MPWVPSSSLITTGAPPTRSIAGMHVGAVAHERRGRHRDVVLGQDLRGAQLVAGVGDAVRRVGRVDVHLLELPHDGGAEVGDRVADARQDRVVVGELLAAVLQVGFGRPTGRSEAQGVEHLHDVPAILGGGAEALRAVGARGAGQDGEFHGITPDWIGGWRAIPSKHPRRVARVGAPARHRCRRGSRPSSTPAPAPARSTPSTSRSSTATARTGCASPSARGSARATTQVDVELPMHDRRHVRSPRPATSGALSSC